jgi:hypothetical protein
VLRRLWRTSPELIVTAALMVPVLAGALVGLLVDPRVITGAPAWLKPAKFASSIMIYTVTLAWIFMLLPEWRRLRRTIGWITAITMVLEMAIIGTQAWRGTASHFNFGTPLDAVLLSIMGAAIVFQTFSTVAVAVALWRHRFDDQPLAWALRLGMTITIAGALTGGLMTRPTTAQLEAARAGAAMTVAGAHTVGAADGGPGLIGTGWSTEHGDLRVPHFIGLHAVQALPLLVLLLTRAGIGRARRERLMLIAGPSYAALWVILLIQALRGVPAIAPDNATLTQLGAWALVTAIATGFVTRGSERVTREISDWTRDPGRGIQDEGQRTRDRGRGTEDEGPRTRDPGPGTSDLRLSYSALSAATGSTDAARRAGSQAARDAAAASTATAATSVPGSWGGVSKRKPVMSRVA